MVLLIDEVDRLDVETEALLLEVLSDYQVSIPELGTVTGRQVPAVFLTSNGSRDLSEALRRRCLYLHLDYPPAEREREIVRTRVPGIPEHLAGQIAAFVGSLRRLDLRQRPSVTQTLEWARTLLALGAQDLDAGLAAESLPVLLTYRSDIDLAAAELGLPAELGWLAERASWLSWVCWRLRLAAQEVQHGLHAPDVARGSEVIDAAQRDQPRVRQRGDQAVAGAGRIFIAQHHQDLARDPGQVGLCQRTLRPAQEGDQCVAVVAQAVG